jgi:lipoprotein-anchoring transpeptidase ErfK/SrfK
MASTSADFLLICEGLFKPWHQASPAAVAAATAAASGQPAVAKGTGIVEEYTIVSPHAIGAKRRKVDGTIGTSSRCEWRTWTPERQLRVSKAISEAPWKRPVSPYLPGLQEGHGASSSSTDSR